MMDLLVRERAFLGGIADSTSGRDIVYFDLDITVDGAGAVRAFVSVLCASLFL